MNFLFILRTIGQVEKSWRETISEVHLPVHEENTTPEPEKEKRKPETFAAHNSTFFGGAEAPPLLVYIDREIAGRRQPSSL